jgi:chromatin modification-related protein YNG2
MILWDNPNCRYEWFHFSCVNFTTEPIQNWFCDDCYHA